MTDTTTPLSCPSWCTLPEGHDLDILLREDVHTRVHESEHRGPDWSTVVMTATEMMLPDGSTVMAPAAVELEVRPVGRHNAEELRQMAAALLNAADEIDQTTGARP